MAGHVLSPPGICREGAATGCPSTRKSRRDVLGAAGFTALAGIAAVAIAKPDASAEAAPAALYPDDAELIAIGREAAELIERRKPLEARWWALPPMAGGARRRGTPSEREMNAVARAMEPIDARLDALTERALDLHATCRESLVAKALLVRHDMAISHAGRGQVDLDGMHSGERITWSLLDDLLAVQS